MKPSLLVTVLLAKVVFALASAPAEAPAQTSRAEGAPASGKALHSAADSAQAARDAFRQASLALRAGDSAAAALHLERAADSWPTQGAYWLAAARLAGRRGDSTGAARALERLASIGLGVESDDPAFARLRTSARWRSAAARAAANVSTLEGSTVAFTLGDSAFFPEGLAHDPRDGSWYLSSVRTGHIVRVAADGRATPLTSARTAEALDAALGIALDTARHLLWVASAAIPPRVGFDSAADGRSALVALSLGDGAVVQRWVAPDAAAGHAFGDVAVAPNGDVFVSDTRAAAVYRLRAARVGPQVPTGALERVAISPLVRSPQGILPLEADSALLIADYSHGLLRVSLGDGRVERIAEPAGATLLGVDGLCRAGTVVYGVQNGVTPPRLVRLTFDPRFTRLERFEVVDRQPSLAPEPTQCAITRQGDVHYLANSQWEAYDERGRRRAGATLAPPRVLRRSGSARTP